MTTPDSRHLFINLASGDGARAGKALRQGRMFLEAGWDVTLMLNVDAVVLVDPASESSTCPVSGKPLGAMLAAFADAGGRALVGAECLKLAGIAQDTLPAGCDIGTFPLVEELLARPGTRTLSW